MSATLGLEVDADRCQHGYHISQHPTFCGCTEMTEWAIFTAALASAARPGRHEDCAIGERHVHQDNVRPRIRGRIEPKHIGGLYRRAKQERLLVHIGKEPSGDSEGRNTHHDSPVYALRGTR